MALKLDLDQQLIDSCREYTSEIADEIGKKISKNTTTSVERTVLRLLGVDGVDQHGIPLPNVIVEKVKEAGKFHVEGKNYVVEDGDILHIRFNV